MPTIVSIIVAIGPNRVIGSDNQMPWHLPRDLRFFRQVTQGHSVVMGRKTFESLGCRALPRRRNIVITRNPDYNAPKCELATSLQSAVRICDSEERIYVIGGGEIYRQALAIADEIYVTEIRDFNPNFELFPSFTGDTYFPEIPESEWRLARPGKRWFLAASRVPALASDKLKRKGMRFRFMKYERRRLLLHS